MHGHGADLSPFGVKIETVTYTVASVAAYRPAAVNQSYLYFRSFCHNKIHRLFLTIILQSRRKYCNIKALLSLDNSGQMLYPNYGIE